MSMENYILLIAVVAALAWGAYNGYKRGFLENIVHLITGLLGVFVLFVIAKAAGSFIEGSYLGVVMAFILLLGIHIVNKITSFAYSTFKLVRALTIGRMVDRVAGIVLGLVKIVIIIWLFFIIISLFNWYGINDWVLEQVMSSRLLTFLYRSNYILVLLERWQFWLH